MITTDKDRVQNDRAAGPDESGGSDTMLIDVWGLVRRRKGLLFFGFLAGLSLATLYYFQAQRLYESEVQILVMTKDSNLPAHGADRDPENLSGNAFEGLLATQMETFRSPKIVADAIEKRQLKLVPSIAEAIAEEEDPVDYVIDNLDVSRGGEGLAKDAHVIRATYRDPDPENCALILEAITESYQEYVKSAFQGTGKEAYDLTVAEADKARRDVDAADAAYQAFLKRTPLVRSGESASNVHLDRLREIETSLSQMRIRKMETAARLEVIEEAMENRGDKLTDLDKLALLGEDVNRLALLVDASRRDAWSSEEFQKEQPIRTESARAQYERLLTLMLEKEKYVQDFGPDHPEVQRVQQQIDLTRQFLDKGTETVSKGGLEVKATDLFAVHLGLLKHDMAEMEKREAELVKLAKQEEDAARAMLTFEAEDRQLRDDLARKKELYEATVERVRDVDLIQQYSGYWTEVLAPVEAAQKPAWPRLELVLALGAVVGVFCGGLLAYVAEVTDRTFRSPDELHHVLDLPVLAHIPVLPELKRGRGGRGDDRLHPTLLTHHRPKSRSAEAFRGLRTALYFGAKTDLHKILQVTSPSPGDGKTTVASNLAVSMAQSGKRVLLVDCDFRKPRVGKLFGIDGGLGLSNVILNEVTLADAVHDVGVVNLHVLVAGTSRANPAELLTMRSFEEFVRDVRDQYDLVILDSPPLLAVSDPCIIAPRVDGVVLAMKIDKQGRPRALRAKEMLTGLGVRVHGVVVNGIEVNRHYGYGEYGGRYSYGQSYGYPYGYGYGYGYTYGEQNNHYYADDDPKEAAPQPPAPPTVQRPPVAPSSELARHA